MNARMPELKACFEAAGFTDVRTLLSSGNVVFNARSSFLPTLERRAEKAMQVQLGRSFETFVRSAEFLQQLVESKPFAEFDLLASAKQIVTFLRQPLALSLALPIERGDASILRFTGAVHHHAHDRHRVQVRSGVTAMRCCLKQLPESSHMDSFKARETVFQE